MKFKYNDGGRALAGYKGTTGDCVCRAICIASQLPYKEVYDTLAIGNFMQRKGKRTAKRKQTASHGINVNRKWFKDYMQSIGFVWIPTMGIGTGCKVHLTNGELPMGRLVVSVSKHYTAVIDGVVNDLYNPERNIHCTDGYGNHSIQRRCVYGYYKFIK